MKKTFKLEHCKATDQAQTLDELHDIAAVQHGSQVWIILHARDKLLNGIKVAFRQVKVVGQGKTLGEKMNYHLVTGLRLTESNRTKEATGASFGDQFSDEFDWQMTGLYHKKNKTKEQHKRQINIEQFVSTVFDESQLP